LGKADERTRKLGAPKTTQNSAERTINEFIILDGGHVALDTGTDNVCARNWWRVLYIVAKNGPEDVNGFRASINGLKSVWLEWDSF